MSITWTCKFGFYHDRHVVFNEPASNNGWIYTAYASLLGLPIDKELLARTFDECLTDEYSDWVLKRRPDKFYPPISRDELIGMAILGFKAPAHIMKTRRWSWVKDRDFFNMFSWLDTAYGFYKAIGKHRNFIWKEKILACYVLMFSLRAHDRYFFKKDVNIEPTLWERLNWKVYKHWTNWRGTPGDKNVMWAQCTHLGDEYRFKVNHAVNFTAYFPVGHILVERAKSGA